MWAAEQTLPARSLSSASLSSACSDGGVDGFVCAALLSVAAGVGGDTVTVVVAAAVVVAVAAGFGIELIGKRCPHITKHIAHTSGSSVALHSWETQRKFELETERLPAPPKRC